MTAVTYTEDTIRTLDWKEHIRKRPGMYIGKLGDGSSQDDGIYVLLKEVLDNAIDEFMMGFGNRIDITINERYCSGQGFRTRHSPWKSARRGFKHEYGGQI